MATSIVKVLITGDAKGLHRATESSIEDMEHTGKHAGNVAGKIKAGFAVGAGAAIAFGEQAIEAFNGQQKAQDRLEVAITNAGGTWEKYAGSIKKADTAGTQFGYDNGQINQALATLTSGLNDPVAALKDLQLAEDISAAKGYDLNKSALLVTKSAEGQTKALKALGIDLPIAAGGAVKLKTAQDGVKNAEDGLRLVEEKIHDGRLKGPAATDALRAANDGLKTAQSKLNSAQSAGVALTDALTDRYRGSASKEADTFEGKVAAQAAAWRNVKAEAGKAITDGLIKFQEWSQKTGRPEIDRFQTDLGDLAHSFDHVTDRIAAAADDLTTTIANDVDAWTSDIAKGILSFQGSGADVYDALHPNAGKGTPGAAAADRARLDAINRANARKHPTSGGTAPRTSADVAGNIGTVIVNLPAGADPSAVTAALTRYSRRNGT